MRDRAANDQRVNMIYPSILTGDVAVLQHQLAVCTNNPDVTCIQMDIIAGLDFGEVRIDLPTLSFSNTKNTK